MEMVRASGAVSLRELARVVQTSEVTVRRDVRALEAEGLLDRRHGGAVLPGGYNREPHFQTRAHLHPEKQAIAEFAATLVNEGDTIMVGAGSTTLEFAKHLSRIPRLTVVTNSLPVAHALAGATRVEVVMTGGTLSASRDSLVGDAEERVREMRASKAFISGAGVTTARGLSSANMLSASVDQAIVESSGAVIVLADYSKLGTDSMFPTVSTEAITRLITDQNATVKDPASRELQLLADCGVRVTVAPIQSIPSAS